MPENQIDEQFKTQIYNNKTRKINENVIKTENNDALNRIIVLFFIKCLHHAFIYCGV